jgi:hypothetical protein
MEITVDTLETQADRFDGARLYSASPFAGGGLTTVAGGAAEADPVRGGAQSESTWLSSPFAAGYAAGDEGAAEQLALEALYDEVADESFDEAVEGLIDEVAARHLTAMSSWSSEGESAALASSEVADWVNGLAVRAEHLLDHLAQQFADRPPESLTEDELVLATGRLRAGGDELADAGEQFLGGLMRKVARAAKAVTSVAAKGLAALGKVLPIGKLLEVLKRLVRPLLTRVLRTATNRLPAGLRAPAVDLARKLGLGGDAPAGVPAGTPANAGTSGGTGGTPAPATEFDRQLAEALAAGTDSAVEQIMAEAAHEAEQLSGVDPLAALDNARATLARRLAEAEPGRPPAAEVDQFIPAVLAAMPLVRMGIRVAGRERVVRLLADGLAALISGHIGPAAARALAPPIADVGLRLLSLEAEAPDTLGSEALVSTLEDTIRQVAALPAASLEEPLRLEAELQQAFTEAATRHLPRHLLRADLGVHETVGEGGVWVLMPRAARPSLRYRKYSRVYRVPISRPQARAIVLLGEETLEERLLDAGVRSWPVQAEVHLYEAIPGTHLGHLAAFEGEGAPAATDEFEELTPDTAALLIGEPGLGRAAAAPVPRGHRPQPGQRLFRLVVPGVRVRRRRRRIALRLDAGGTTPVLRVHLRLSEREAHEVSQQLARNALPQVVAFARGLLGPPAQQGLATRLARLRTDGNAGVPADRAQALSAHIAESILATLAKQLPTSAAALAAAAKDPAAGLTLTFAFPYTDRAAVRAGLPGPAALSIKAGYQRG